MRNLVTGLSLGFALGILLSIFAEQISAGGFPVVRFVFVLILLAGIAFALLQTYRSQVRTGSTSNSPKADVPSEN